MEQQALQARRQSSQFVGVGPSSARCAQQGRRAAPEMQAQKLPKQTSSARTLHQTQATLVSYVLAVALRSSTQPRSAAELQVPQMEAPQAEHGSLTDMFLWENEKRLQVQVDTQSSAPVFGHGPALFHLLTTSLGAAS